VIPPQSQFKAPKSFQWRSPGAFRDLVISWGLVVWVIIIWDHLGDLLGEQNDHHLALESPDKFSW